MNAVLFYGSWLKKPTLFVSTKTSQKQVFQINGHKFKSIRFLIYYILINLSNKKTARGKKLKTNKIDRKSWYLVTILNTTKL